MLVSLIILFILLIYLVILAGFYFKQRTFYYRPYKTIDQNPCNINLDYDDVWIRTSDKEFLNAWYIPSEKPNGKTILFCHGNSGNISHVLDTIGEFVHYGYNFLAFDYRGFGLSSGTPTEQGFYTDADAALSFLIAEKNISIDNITLMGRSIGGAVAIELATKNSFPKIIIDSTFTSMYKMARKMYPLFALEFLMVDKFDSINKIQQVRSDILFLHSDEDKFVPYKHSVQLIDNAVNSKNKDLVVLKGNHNDSFALSIKTYMDAVNKFLGI